jgi:hypothetical protein
MIPTYEMETRHIEKVMDMIIGLLKFLENFINLLHLVFVR